MVDRSGKRLIRSAAALLLYWSTLPPWHLLLILSACSPVVAQAEQAWQPFSSEKANPGGGRPAETVARVATSSSLPTGASEACCGTTGSHIGGPVPASTGAESFGMARGARISNFQ